MEMLEMLMSWCRKSPGNGAYVDDIGMVQVELAHGAPHQVEDMALNGTAGGKKCKKWIETST